MIAPATRQVNPLQNPEVVRLRTAGNNMFLAIRAHGPCIIKHTMQDSTKIDIQLSAGTFYMI